jgi:hypothetical protein
MKYLTLEQNARNVRDYRPIPLLIESQVLTQKSREGAINIMDGVKKSKKPKYTPPLSANVFAENLQHANYIKDNIKKNRRIRGAYLTEYEKLYDDLIGKKQREIEEAQLQRSGDLYAEMVQAQEVYEAIRGVDTFMIPNPRRSQGQQVRRGRERNEKKERNTMSEEDRDADEGYSAPEVEMIRRINEL